VNVIVTGASRGIGRATAALLAARGDRVALVARDRAALVRLAAPDLLPGVDVSPRAVVIDADLGSIPALRSVVPRAVDALGSIDALVSCAGIADHRPLDAVDEAQIDLHHALHVRAPLILARDLAAHLAGRAAEGAIVNVASTLGIRGAAGTSAYAASKGALIAATKSLAIELAPRIRVSCVAPGAVDTDMIRGRADTLAPLHALRRIGTAAEVADAIAYLLDARFVTGAVLVVDGGLLLGG
jgi:NAD(P)-dependent dehydrogenase (short-subunit alcohol dehydrogenase family)